VDVEIGDAGASGGGGERLTVICILQAQFLVDLNGLAAARESYLLGVCISHKLCKLRCCRCGDCGGRFVDWRMRCDGVE
jgi:hypothetical protein